MVRLQAVMQNGPALDHAIGLMCLELQAHDNFRQAQPGFGCIEQPAGG